MPTIKNVRDTVGEMHDGRPIAAFETRKVSFADLQHDHYQQRIADGAFLVVDDAKPKRTSTTTEEGKS